jgi:hypothetical protein
MLSRSDMLPGILSDTYMLFMIFYLALFLVFDLAFYLT